MDSQEQIKLIESVREGNTLTLRLSGDWSLRESKPEFNTIKDTFPEGKSIQGIKFDVSQLVTWESGLLTFLLKVIDYGKERGLEVYVDSLPDNMQRLLRLSQEVPKKEDVGKRNGEHGFLPRLGKWGISIYDGGVDFTRFFGEVFLSVLKLLSGRYHMRWGDFFVIIQETGAKALPIVSLIALLIGLIVAFLGSITLARFGAEIYVSYLVAYGILREMGAVMTGVIVAGRTGAAFAAQIGTMKVTEEIDALKTMGISPVDFIVMPRMLALIIMMPLLVLYADLIGIIGGLLVSTLLLDFSVYQFLEGMNEAVALPDFYIGLVKGTIFGILIAISGCLRGMQCGNSADAVGLAATSAVVTGITLIIFANAVIDWIAAIHGF